MGQHKIIWFLNHVICFMQILFDNEIMNKWISQYYTGTVEWRSEIIQRKTLQMQLHLELQRSALYLLLF